MSISQSLARVLQLIRAERGLSYADFADELGIPKSSLVEYSNGTGNPRADTLEMLARELSVPITEIVSGPLPGQEQTETIIRAAREFADLTPEKRERGIQLFQELAALFTEEDLT